MLFAVYNEAHLTLSAGEYPSNLAEAAPEIGVTGLFAPGDDPGTRVQVGDPTKLYQLVMGAGQNAFVASGQYEVSSMSSLLICVFRSRRHQPVERERVPQS